MFLCFNVGDGGGGGTGALVPFMHYLFTLDVVSEEG